MKRAAVLSPPVLPWLLGAVFAVIGAVNLGTAVIPMRLGDTNWEVAAFGEFGTSLALATLGSVILGFIAIRHGRSAPVLAVAVWLALLGTLAALGTIVLGLDIPLVIQVTAAGGASQMQLRTLVGRSILLLGLYAMGLWVLAGQFVGSFRRLNRLG